VTRPLRRQTRARDPQATRRALKQAATALFARRGFAGATADLIARRAGVNKAMINYHFGGKRGLYSAIVRESFAALMDRLKSAVDVRAAPADQLRNFIAAFAEMAQGLPDLPAMLLREMIAGGEHRDLDREVFEYLPRILGTVRGVLEAGIRGGSFRPVDPLLTHLSMIGCLMFFFATDEFRRRALAEMKHAPSPPSAADFVRHLQDLMTRGIVAGRHGAARKR
jgi:TetR/AcrR family transcriptional regulator